MFLLLDVDLSSGSILQLKYHSPTCLSSKIQFTFQDLIQYANNSDNDYVRLQVLKIIEALINGGGYISPKCAPGRIILKRFSIKCNYQLDLKKLLQMFTMHNNIELAYQCCSTTLRIVLKYRNTSHILSTSLFTSDLLLIYDYLFFSISK